MEQDLWEWESNERRCGWILRWAWGAGVREPRPWTWPEEIETGCNTDAPTVAEAHEKCRAGNLTEANARHGVEAERTSAFRRMNG